MDIISTFSYEYIQWNLIQMFADKLLI
jgi:hypothetical protein